MLKDYLNSRNVKYESIIHYPAYTAQEIAASAHVKGRELAKTVIVKLDGAMTMCVLPASHSVDFELLRRNTGSREAVLVREEEYSDRFPGCDPGAQPPFGNLFGMDVLASRALLEDRDIVFNAGSFYELIKLSLKDYMSLVKPAVVDFSVRTERRKAA